MAKGSDYAALDSETRAAFEWMDLEDEAYAVLDAMEFQSLAAIETPPVEWLIKDVWPLGSHGMIGGAEKSFKSFLSAYGALCIASGKPFFETYPVRQGPVVIFTGEGSAALLKRRMLRIASGLGISRSDMEDLPIVISAKRLPLTDPQFQGALAASFVAIAPRLVIVDPLYAYHGSSSEGGSVYQEGDLLATLSDITAPNGVALWVVHHFNKPASERGAGMSLTGLTMAGGREWVDSWMLVQKREEPDFDRERVVKLALNTGTRQDEVSHEWHVDLELDERLADGSYAGGITWTHRDAKEGEAEDRKAARQGRLNILRDAAVEVIRQSAEGMTTSEVKEQLREDGVRFGNDDVLAALGQAALTGIIGRATEQRSADRRAVELWKAL